MQLHNNVHALFPPGIQPLVTVPAPVSAPFAPLADRRASSDGTMIEIARRLGIAGRSRRGIIDTVRALNGGYGFPDPKNPRMVKGALITGPRAIVWASVFPRARLEDWFDHHRSAAQRAADDGDEAAAAAATLAANSARLARAVDKRSAVA